MDSQLARICELKIQLLHLGYLGFQVDAMLRDVLGSAAAEAVGPDKRQEVIDTLEKYAYFAIKSHRGVNRTRRFAIS
jgi:hypothetical protein